MDFESKEFWSNVGWTNGICLAEILVKIRVCGLHLIGQHWIIFFLIVGQVFEWKYILVEIFSDRLLVGRSRRMYLAAEWNKIYGRLELRMFGRVEFGCWINRWWPNENHSGRVKQKGLEELLWPNKINSCRVELILGWMNEKYVAENGKICGWIFGWLGMK